MKRSRLESPDECMIYLPTWKPEKLATPKFTYITAWITWRIFFSPRSFRPRLFSGHLELCLALHLGRSEDCATAALEMELEYNPTSIAKWNNISPSPRFPWNNHINWMGYLPYQLDGMIAKLSYFTNLDGDVPYYSPPFGVKTRVQIDIVGGRKFYV